MREFQRCFQDWLFWMSSDVFQPEDRNRNISYISRDVKGQMLRRQVFWYTLNEGRFEMLWEFYDW